MRKLCVFGVMLIIGLSRGMAQLPADSVQTVRHRYLLTGLPLVYYTPETRWAFGASALFFFNFKSDTIDAPRSTLSLAGVYTQNKQWLFTLPYNLFVKNKRYWLYGEVTYNRFMYNFYGVGNNHPLSYVERYGVQFPRIRISALRKVNKYLYAGIRYAYDRVELFDLAAGGQLLQGNIPGSNGGTVSGLGAIALYDSRNSVFYPGKGTWAEFVVYRDDPTLGSSFKYARFTFDLCKYFSVGKNTFALNGYALYSDTDLPFFQMAGLGGGRRMRGFYDMRFRDNNALVFQAEYRRPVWGPLGFTLFAGTGQVMHRFTEVSANNWRFTCGGGIRCLLDPKQKVYMRLDVGYGLGKFLPYLTIAETF